MYPGKGIRFQAYGVLTLQRAYDKFLLSHDAWTLKESVVSKAESLKASTPLSAIKE